MIEEAARTGIERRDGTHVVVGELKVEDVEILSDPLFPHGFRDRDDATLRQPTDDDLRNRLTMSVSDGLKQRVVEEVVSSFREGPPGFDLYAVLLEELLCCNLLVERVGLDLVHCWLDVVVHEEVHD